MKVLKYGFFIIALISLTFPLASATDVKEKDAAHSISKAETIALKLFKDDNIFRAIDNVSGLTEEFEWLTLAVQSRALMNQGHFKRSEAILREAARLSPGRTLDYVDKILGIIEINLARRTRSQKEFEHLLSTYDKRHNGTEPDLKRYQMLFDERQFNQDYPLEISGLSPDSPITLTIEETERVPRISVPVQIGSRNINFLLDTGATISTLFNPELENIDLISTGINIPMYSQGSAVSETQLSKLSRVKIGHTEIKNLNVLNVTDNPFDDELRRKGISGLLGSDIIEKFGGIQLSTKDYRITKAEFYTPKDKNINPLNGNLLKYYRDPHVKVSIGNKIYTCIFDTGATKSHITVPIYKEYKKALNLKRISGKKTRPA